MKYVLSKVASVACHREETSKHFCPLPFHIGVAKKNTRHSRAGWDNTLLTGRRDRARSVSTATVGPPRPAGPSWQLTWGHWPACTSLVPQQKDPVLSSHRGQIEHWVWPGTTRHTCLSRTKEHTVSLKQGKIFPPKVTRPARAVWLLTSWGRRPPGHGPSSCGQAGV